MQSWTDGGRQAARLMVFLALFIALLGLCTRPVGLNVALRDEGVRIEMKMAFLEMTFDFGQSRSKSNGLAVVL